MAEKKHVDKYIFWVCLVASITIGVVSFILPPTGVIDPSCLKFIALLFGFSALGIAGQNLANGKDVTVKHGDTTVKVNDDENE